MTTFERALEWIESRRDREQVIYTTECAAELRTRALKSVQRAFRAAMLQNLIGWDQRCYYTIPRTP